MLDRISRLVFSNTYIAEKLAELRRQLERGSFSSVWIHGKAGTGKHAFARALLDDAGQLDLTYIRGMDPLQAEEIVGRSATALVISSDAPPQMVTQPRISVVELPRIIQSCHQPDHYLRLLQRNGLKVELSREGTNYFNRYGWPGNFEELVEVVNLAEIVNPDSPVDAGLLANLIAIRAALPVALIGALVHARGSFQKVAADLGWHEFMRLIEAFLLAVGMERCGDKLTAAAQAFQVPISTLSCKRQSLGARVQSFRDLLGLTDPSGCPKPNAPKARETAS